MHLTELIPAEGLKALQEELAARFGLNADIMDADGKRLFGTTFGNELCRRIRDDEKGFGAICVPAGQMFTHLMRQGEPFHEECDAGMMRVAVPVLADGRVIGSIGGCGLVVHDGEPDGFTIGMMSGIEESVATDMAARLDRAHEGAVGEIQDFIRQRIEALRK